MSLRTHPFRRLSGRVSITALATATLVAAALLFIGLGSPPAQAQPRSFTGGGAVGGGGVQPPLFSGPGVNCHFTWLPTDDAALIGITWYRIDDGNGTVPTAAQVDEMLLHYGSSHILWLIDQTNLSTELTEGNLVYSRSVALGVPPPVFEFLNEPMQWLMGKGMSATDAAAWYHDQYLAFKAGMPSDAIVTAGADLDNLDYYIRATGLHPDRWSYHNYNFMPEGQPQGYDYMASIYNAPVIDSEGDYFEFSRGAEYYLKMYQKMGTRPWCFYDGPETDPRGLWAQHYTDSLGIVHWDIRSDTYNQILAGLNGGTTGGSTGGTTGLSGGTTGLTGD